MNTASLNNARATHKAPKLERIYVGFDASIKAVYADNTVLVLSAEGQSFTHVSSSGVSTVQLCEFCLSRFAPLLRELLDFRNQHVDVPASCSPLRQQLAKHGQLFQLGYPITDVCWPATPEEAFHQQLVELPDKQRIIVRSRCCSARIMLEYTGLRFAVSYPLLIEFDTATNEYTYTWQTQVFSRNQYPARWQPALAVACAVADNAAQGFHDPHQVRTFQHTVQEQSLTSPTTWRGSCRTHTPYSRSDSPCRSRSISPVQRCSSPLQRQHQAWQPQQQLSQYSGPRGTYSITATSGVRAASRPWSPSKVQQQSCQAVIAECSGNSSSCITQLPISEELLHTIPQHHQHLRRQQQQIQQKYSSGNPCSSSSSSNKLAAALAQALGQRQTSCSISSSSSSRATIEASLGRGWWLEPTLMLPTDEPLQLMWSREATCVFVQDVEEVEVWLHADDSCLYSFQSGAFVTHLLPKAAAASWDSATAGNMHHSLAVATASAATGSPSAGAAAASWGSAAGGSVHHSLAAATPPTAAAGSAPAASPNSAAAASNVPHTLALAVSRGAAAAAAASPASAVSAAAQCGLASPDRNQPDIWGLVDGVVDPSDMSRVYAATALPEVPVTTTVTSGDGRSEVVRVPVGQIAAAALKFRSAMARIKRCLLSSNAVTAAAAAAATTAHSTSNQQQGLLPTHPQQQQQQQAASTDIFEQQEVPGLGKFTAYTDGRIRVLFDDRTILILPADHSSADLVMPDGSSRTVPTAKPLGVEQYVQAALEYAAWSSTTPEHRAAALRLQALVAAELRSSARMAAICEWGSTCRLPPPAAAAAQQAAKQDLAEAQHTSDEAAGLSGELAGGLLTVNAVQVAAGQAAFPSAGQAPGCSSAPLASVPQESWIRKYCGEVDSQETSPVVGASAQQVGLLDRELAVEKMLQANARLLERLRV